jgi:acyl CoA:acetate/3-ketoacid CoA transferase beta subunit
MPPSLLLPSPQIVVAMHHTARMEVPKVLKKCTLPVTGKGVVDMIITDLAVFKVRKGQPLLLIEKVPGVSVEYIQKRTEAVFEVSPTLQDMLQ